MRATSSLATESAPARLKSSTVYNMSLRSKDFTSNVRVMSSIELSILKINPTTSPQSSFSLAPNAKS